MQFVFALVCAVAPADAPVPEIVGPWRTVAGDPDLGPLASPMQQPVDFAVWQAADGTWQLWSCIRKTKATGMTRLFHRWEANAIEDADWTPKGIAMQADPARGETEGGLQAPFVFKVSGEYRMVYGDWENICLASSKDGKNFERVPVRDGKPALFSEAPRSNTRDPMILRHADRWFCYYTAHPNNQGAVFCRTSADLLAWDESTAVAFGGKAGTGPYAAECPFVLQRGDTFLLFRTRKYGKDAKTSIYRSADPRYFGINQDDRFLVGSLPVAAPEIVTVGDRHHLFTLRPDLKGIQAARLHWPAGK